MKTNFEYLYAEDGDEAFYEDDEVLLGFNGGTSLRKLIMVLQDLYRCCGDMEITYTNEDGVESYFNSIMLKNRDKRTDRFKKCEIG